MTFKRKYILPGVAILLLVIQFFRIDKTNPPADMKDDFVLTMNTPSATKMKIMNSCYDCHSNTTTYPWYTNVAPLSWWIKGHINGGREHLNFSEWTNYSDSKKAHNLEECVEVLEKKWMPMATYTWLHPKARMTDAERADLIAYFKSIK
jgi:hypothetical protein